MIVNRVRHGFRRRLAQLWVDQGGAVTIQVLVMSILLLGTTGLVLDAGRAFSTHSQMQAFADQVALAAAAELDRKDDSITRARAAAFGVNDDPFLTDADSNGVAYEVDQVTFYADIPAQSGTQSDNSDMVPFQIADEVTDAATAQYVQVTVREREVTSLLSGMAGVAYAMTGQTNPFDSRIRLSTTAVAGLEIQTCADISSLVLCNPWEGRSDDPFTETPPTDPNAVARVPGRSLQYFAPNFDKAGVPEGPVADGRDFGGIYPYSVKNQLFRLTNPVSDPGGACSAAALQLLGIAAAEGSTDYLTARDTCLMARARSERVCFGETVNIQAAPGTMVTPAINTIFDIYLAPFDQVLTNGNAPIADTGLSLAQFFEPDALASTVFEPLPRDAAGNLLPQQVVGDVTVMEFTHADGVAGVIPLSFELPYEARPYPDARQLPFIQDMGYAYCHLLTMTQFGTSTGTQGCRLPFVGDDNALDSDGDGTPDDENNDGVADVVYDNVAGYDQMIAYIQNYYNNFDPALDLPTGTWYNLYKWEREKVRSGAFSGSACLALEDRMNDPYAEPYLPDCDATPVKTDPTNYLDPDGVGRALLNEGYERRRVRSAMVNCSAATANPTIDGAYQTPIASIVDIYIPRPAEYICGTDPSGTTLINCPVEDQIESRLYVELIERVDEAKTERFTAQLVR